MHSLIRSAVSSIALLAVLSPFICAEEIPKTWVDKDTGHRIWRLSDEANSGGFYFNINAYTPDHRSMIYTAPDGIHVLDMETHKTRLLVPDPPAATAGTSTDPSAVRGAGAGRNPHALVAGNKTNSVFYTQLDPTTHTAAVYKADTNTGAIRKLTDLPPKISIVSVNADETLAAGTYIEGDATGKEYGSNAPAPPAPALPPASLSSSSPFASSPAPTAKSPAT
jgi:oligogalacturonide lyase